MKTEMSVNSLLQQVDQVLKELLNKMIPKKSISSNFVNFFRRSRGLKHEHFDHGYNTSNRCDLLFRLFHLDCSLLQVCYKFRFASSVRKWQLTCSLTCLQMFYHLNCKCCWSESEQNYLLNVYWVYIVCCIVYFAERLLKKLRKQNKNQVMFCVNTCAKNVCNLICFYIFLLRKATEILKFKIHNAHS